MILRTLFFYCLFLPVLLTGKTIETGDITELKKHVGPGTLLVCDIDNTLIEPAQMLGSVGWCECYLYQQYKKLGLSDKEIYKFGQDKWNIVQSCIPVKTVDKCTSMVLKECQAKGAIIFGLTARQIDEIEYTHKHLESVGIKFNQELIAEAHVDFRLPYNAHKAAYNRGVIFSNWDWKKSQQLKEFLNLLSLEPKKIVFIDDKWSHVKDVEQMVKGLGIEFVGVRYSGADEHIKNFDCKIAEIQWSYFPYILSDDEARLMLLDDL